MLDYLVAALDTPESTGRIIEIGGADVLTYGDLLRGYAKARGLKRWLVPVPVLTPRLASCVGACKKGVLRLSVGGPGRSSKTDAAMDTARGGRAAH